VPPNHYFIHPDLVPPNTSVERFTDTQHLYDVLEGVGGIAEFIIPMLYNGHFDNGLTWLRPQWSKQLPDNERQAFYIGDNNQGKCCVSLPEPYYFDEGVVYEANDLLNARKVLLTVHTDSTATIPIEPVQPSKWILDICLDYFTVSNPFLTELMDIIENSSCSIDVVGIISKMYDAVWFRRSEDCNCTCRSLTQRRVECAKFTQLVNTLLTARVMDSYEDLAAAGTSDMVESAASTATNAITHQFMALFQCTCETTSLIDREEALRYAKEFVTMCSVIDETVRDFLRGAGLCLRSYVHDAIHTCYCLFNHYALKTVIFRFNMHHSLTFA
jgi:hypothetical protein